MSMRFSRRRFLIASALLLLALGAGVYALLGWRVRRALETPGGNRAALSFQPLPAPPQMGQRWGGGEVEGVAASASSLITAGGSGVWDETGDISGGLPTLRASALTLWRGRAVVALAAGGLFLRRDGHWEEARTGFGALHVRCLREGPGGELLVGAQEGLYRAAWGASSLERLDKSPVRSLALDPSGLLLAGGEAGLHRVEGARVELIATADPWVDFVALRGRELVVATPLGLAAGPLGGSLLPLPDGQEVSAATQVGEHIYAIAEGRLLRFEASGRAAEEFLPAPPRRLFAVSDLLFADTANGLYRKTREGWTLVRARVPSLPPGPCHVTALASLGGHLVLGLFDGGLLAGTPQAESLAFAAVPGSSAWGVNALLPAGGVLYVGSLRGAARYDGSRLETLSSEGGVYALARAQAGVAIGTGQGLLLADGRFLSAFHGLPGNQVLALADAGDQLFVGTPSGLGAVRAGQVLWRAVAGDGRLPHPWITALSLFQKDLFIGTYGGGVTRRSPLPEQLGAPGTFEAFPETQGFKINTGCLLSASGQLFLGSDGQGLWVLRRDGSRFERLAVPLPSPRITALFAEGDWLYIGTDEGLLRLPIRSLLGA